jgi:Fe-S cluster assembly protein SufD
VKAAHGATVGRLDANALFYLRSRGLPEELAQQLLTAAFCREPLAFLADPETAAALTARLDKALATAGVA